MTDQNRKTGILLMLSAVTIFAVQDGFSRHLAETYNVFMVIMVRYWFFAGFVILLPCAAPKDFVLPSARATRSCIWPGQAC